MYDNLINVECKTILLERFKEQEMAIGDYTIVLVACGHERGYEDRSVLVNIYNKIDNRDNIMTWVNVETIMELSAELSRRTSSNSHRSFFRQLSKEVSVKITGGTTGYKSVFSYIEFCLNDKRKKNYKINLGFNKAQVNLLAYLITNASRQTIMSTLYHHQLSHEWYTLHSYIDKGLISKIELEVSELNNGYNTVESCDRNIPGYGAGFDIYNVVYFFNSDEDSESVIKPVRAFRCIKYLPVFEDEWNELCETITHGNKDVELVMPCTYQDRYDKIISQKNK